MTRTRSPQLTPTPRQLQRAARKASALEQTARRLVRDAVGVIVPLLIGAALVWAMASMATGFNIGFF